MLISVIIPAYQVEPYISRCLDSVLSQTYQNLEILVIDDGSKDASGKIADEYAAKDSRVKVIHKINAGLPQARKTGVENATGELIGFVDADDWIEPDMYECLYNSLVQNNTDISSIGFMMDWNTHSKDISFSLKNGVVLSPEQAISAIHKRTEVMTYAWNKLYRKEMFNNIDFPTGNIIGEDYNIVMQAISNAKTISVCAGCKYHYIQADTTMSKGGFNNERIISYNMYMNFRDRLLLQYPNLRKEIINYDLIEELAIIVSMGKNNTFDDELRKKIIYDVRHNLNNIIFNNYVDTIFKCSAVAAALHYKLLINIYKIKNS